MEAKNKIHGGFRFHGKAPCASLLAWLLIVLVGSSCRSPRPVASNGNGEAGGSSARDRAVRSGLSLRIVVEVAGRNEVEEKSLRISEAGRISLPLVGHVDLSERSLSEIEDLLSERYAEFFVQPRVAVDFADTTQEGLAPWGTVTVLGCVKKPGPVSLPPTRDLSVSAAIQAAGGLDASARDNAIRVTRPRDDGSEQSFRVNLRAVGSQGKIQQDVPLRDGDVVYVPEAIL